MTNDIAIKVENLSKRYRIGLKEEIHDTLGSAIVDFVSAPLHNFRRLRRLSKFSENDNPKSEILNQHSDIIWALKDVSFEVERGEVVGIIGANGAGKSTLLKILSRITHPTSGWVKLNGRVSSLLEVGTGFHPELTGRDNVYLNGTILGMTKTEVDRKFDEIVDFSGVEKFIDTPVKRYSSGMKVRLAFSVAAHLEPEILLVDEVLAVGDVGFQRKCLGKMDEVASGGRTVFFVSHNMGMIRSLCDRSVLLVDGVVAEDGKSEDVVRTYLSSWSPASEANGAISWRQEGQAPSCEEMKLQSIRLLDSAGSIKETFDVDRPILIEIVYQVHTPLRGMRTVLHLKTEDGVIAFASTDQAQRSNTLEPGRYRSMITIPGNLLNRKKYFVLIHFGIPGVRVLISGQEYLSFTCVRGSVEGPYVSQRWPGVVAPYLEWSLENIT